MNTETTEKPIDLDALEALEKAATEGPWEVRADHTEPRLNTIWTSEGQIGTLIARTCFAPASVQNAELIAATRNALPALLAELRESREALKVAENALTVARGVCGPMIRKHRDRINEAIAIIRKAKGQ